MKRSLLWPAAFALAGLGCNRSPPEPVPVATTAVPTAPSPATAGDTGSEQPGRNGLEWTPPPGWTVEKGADAHDARAKYTVPPVGNDKAPAELQVRFLGRGPQADFDAAVREWMAEFDGNVAADAQRQEFDVGTVHVRTVEVLGTYKQPMGPPIGPHKKAAAYAIKQGWRSILAAASAGNRGVWLFRLLGPDDTVQAARSGMDGMLHSVH
jgi:hypothetical protein